MFVLAQHSTGRVYVFAGIAAEGMIVLGEPLVVGAVHDMILGHGRKVDVVNVGARGGVCGLMAGQLRIDGRHFAGARCFALLCWLDVKGEGQDNALKLNSMAPCARYMI